MTEANAWRAMAGRADERSLVETATAERHRLVLIDGEPGAGKTRLLEHLTDRARAAGRAVLAGSATEFERLVPFGMYVDAFARLSDAVPDAEAEAALRALLSADQAGEANQLDRYHTYRGIRSLLSWASLKTLLTPSSSRKFATASVTALLTPAANGYIWS